MRQLVSGCNRLWFQTFDLKGSSILLLNEYRALSYVSTRIAMRQVSRYEKHYAIQYEPLPANTKQAKREIAETKPLSAGWTNKQTYHRDG